MKRIKLFKSWEEILELSDCQFDQPYFHFTLIFIILKTHIKRLI